MNFCYTSLSEKLLRLFLPIVLFLLSIPMSVQASHIVGGEIGYRCLGGDQYEITLNVYRDCFYGAEDAQFDDPAFVGVFNANSGVLIRQLSVPFMGDDTLSAIFANQCLIIPDDVCVHTSTYRDTIVLESIPDGYEFAYQRCCRNQTITNINQPTEVGATYNIVLTQAAMEGCNSTPRFKEWPPIFVCVDEPIFYDHGAIDEDGDSLVYRLCTPSSGANFEDPQPSVPSNPPYNDINWGGIYSVENMLGMGRPLEVSPNNGFLFARPGLQGQFVVGVCVEEYRDGVLLSTTRRDFQYNIGQCREINAAIGAPEVQCDDLTVNFESLSEEATEFIWQFDINDPNAISTEEDPTYTYPDTGRYVTRLIVEPDEICSDTITQEIYLQDNSITSDLTVRAFNCGDSISLSLIDQSTDSISNIIQREWELTYGGEVYSSNDINASFLLPFSDTTGMVTLTVASQNGCLASITQSFNVGDAQNPLDMIPDEFTICRGDSVFLNPNQDSSLFASYRWRPGVGLSNSNLPNPQASPFDTTVYTVSLNPFGSACILEKEVTVNVLPAPSLLRFRADDDCFTPLRINFSAQFDQADSIRWDFGDVNNPGFVDADFSASYTYPDTGKYEIRIAVFGGECVDTLVRTVSVFNTSGSSNISISAGDDIMTCEDSVTLRATTRNVPQYFWVSAQDSILATNENLTVPVQGNTVYILRAEDFAGCVVEDSIRVIGNQLSFDTSGDVAVCEGEDVDVFIQNLTPEIDSLMYVWSGDSIISGAMTGMPELPNTPGVRNYQVAIQNEFGCDEELDVEVVVVGDDLELGFDPQIQCDGASVLFVNESLNDLGYRYRWLVGDSTNASFVGDSIAFTYMQAGEVTACLTLDYANLSCADTLCQTFIVSPSTITADFEATADSCSAEFTTFTFENLSQDTSGLQYTWTFSDGTTSNEVRPTLTFTETQDLVVNLTVTRGDGCILNTIDTIQVNVLDLNLESVIPLCEGSSVELNRNGNPNLVYDWAPNTGLSATDIPSPIANPTETTSYIVTIFDPAHPNCSAQEAFTIEVSDGLELGFPDVLNNCEQETLLTLPEGLQATATWTDQDGNQVMGSSVLVPSDYSGIYIVEAIDTVGGCTGSDTLQIINENGIDIIKPIGDTITTCEGQTVLIILENGRPQDSIDIFYFPNEHITMGDSTLRPTFNGFADTITILNYIATNQFGCSIEDSLIIKIRDFDTGLPPLASVCENSASTIVPNFDPQFNYTWSPATGLSDPMSGNPEITIGGPTTYTVTVTNGDGAGACRTVKTVEVDVFPDFELMTAETTVLCVPDDVLLEASATTLVDYVWSSSFDFSDTLSTDTTLMIFAEEEMQNFYVQAVDTFGCQRTNLVPVQVLPVMLDIPDTSFGCFGQNFALNAINLGASQELNFTWTPEDILVDAVDTGMPIVRVEEDVVVRGVAESAFGCIDSVETLIQVIDLDDPSIVATANPDTITIGNATQLDVNLDDSFDYSWTPADGLSDPNIKNPMAMPTITTTYTVTIGQGTCTSSRSVEVVVNQGICDEPFIFVPNAFTPNGDGDNDILFVRGNPIDEVYFAVYNRWGQKVFETTDQNFGWDGTFQGKALSPDVFGYYLEVSCFNGDTFAKKGDVSIIR
ncbi:MAG: PKD domain-containing protein [Bacteroidota bacterium]